MQNYLPEDKNVQFDLQYLSISLENKNSASESYKLNKKINKRATNETREKERKLKSTPIVREKDRVRKATTDVREN